MDAVIIDLATLRALEQLSVDIRVSAGLRRKEFVTTLRRRAVAKLNDLAVSYAVELTADDVVYTAVPGKPDAWGCNLYRCRWSPQPGPAELVGGLKDGQELQLVSQRTTITFMMLAPDWKEAAAGNPAGVVPKVRVDYSLAGYNLSNRRFVFRAGETVRID